jgi:hypothetical protein
LQTSPSKPRGRLLKSTKRGGQSGGQEGVKGIRVTPYDTLMTPYFDTLKNNPFINKSKFSDFSAQIHIFFEKLTPSKLTPSNIPEEMCKYGEIITHQETPQYSLK